MPPDSHVSLLKRTVTSSRGSHFSRVRAIFNCSAILSSNILCTLGSPIQLPAAADQAPPGYAEASTFVSSAVLVYQSHDVGLVIDLFNHL